MTASSARHKRAARKAAPRVFSWLLVAAVVPLYWSGLASDEQTHGDETYWSAAGWRATRLLFVERNPGAAYWTRGTSVHILTRDKAREAAANRNPKFATFLLGAAMLASGVPEPPWQSYEFGRTPQWNRAQGRLPSRVTLLAARLPVAALGVMASLWMYSILCHLLRPGPAALGALLVAANPLVILVSQRAMLDGPAYAFSVAAVLAAMRACREGRRVHFWPMCGLAAATCAALSSKPNAGVLIPVLGLVFAVESLRSRSALPVLRLLAAGVAAFALFVLMNPTLYGAPLSGLRDMLSLGGELSRLERMFPQEGLPTLASGVLAAADVLLFEFGTFSAIAGLPLDAVLLTVGVVVLALRWPTSAAARVLLIWLAVGVIAVALWPPVRWNRYYLPGLPPVVAVEYVGTVLLLRGALERIQRWRRTRGASAA